VTLRAPFPWFGGKSRAAHLIWPRFGDVPNYVEPFAGSLAVLLARPHEPRVETVNDKDAYLCNFWRAVQSDPDQVAHYADWPVSEADLHARHRWLVTTARKRMRKVLANPEHYDAKIAGWWVYGLCLWIGSGWCATPVWSGRNGLKTRNGDTSRQARRPQLTCDNGLTAIAAGVHANGADIDRIVDWDVRPDLTAANGRGGVMVAQKPMLTGNGQGVGVHRVTQRSEIEEATA
jgi:hypothetical protein